MTETRIISMTPEAAIELDKHFPPAGPCGICNGPDKRHRQWDAIIARHAAGDCVDSLAKDYGVSAEAIECVLTWRPYQ